jgi:hypothetical protein
MQETSRAMVQNSFFELHHECQEFCIFTHFHVIYHTKYTINLQILKIHCKYVETFTLDDVIKTITLPS